MQTDASGFAIGAVLSQKQDDGSVRPVAYWSQKLVAAPRRYSATERELMAIVEAVRHWRSYLHGSPFPVQLRSDHKPLVYLNSKAELGQRLGRWMEELCDLTFEITYVRGKDNAAADALSRRSDHEVQGAAEAAPASWKVKMVEAQPSPSAESLAGAHTVAGESPGSPARCWRVAGDWMEVVTAQSLHRPLSARTYTIAVIATRSEQQTTNTKQEKKVATMSIDSDGHMP